MKTLTRYIGRELLAAIMLIFSALVMLFAFFDLIHELGDVGRGGYTLSSALLFVGLQLPSRMYELFPVAALISQASSSRPPPSGSRSRSARRPAARRESSRSSSSRASGSSRNSLSPTSAACSPT